jgi:hypothetical protein
MALVNTIIAIMAVVTSAFLGIWVSDRNPPVENLRIEPIQPVRRGDIMRVKNTFLRKRLCHLKLQQVVIDSQDLRMSAPIEEYLTAPGNIGEDAFVVIFRVPPEAHVGPARYRAIRAYYCNPLHTLFDWPIMVVSKDYPVQIVDELVGSDPSLGRNMPNP